MTGKYVLRTKTKTKTKNVLKDRNGSERKIAKRTKLTVVTTIFMYNWYSDNDEMLFQWNIFQEQGWPNFVAKGNFEGKIYAERKRRRRILSERKRKYLRKIANIHLLDLTARRKEATLGEFLGAMRGLKFRLLIA